MKEREWELAYERVCTCKHRTPSRLYLGSWVCACGELIA